MVLSQALRKKTKSKKTMKITKNTQKNHENKKINIIFDLDATLISSNEKTTIYGDEDPHWVTQSIGPHQPVIIPGKKTQTEQEHNLMYYRPYAPELLLYLARQPQVNISVWSAGEKKYVEGICKVLFGVDWKKKLKIVISRKSSIPKYTSIISQTGEVFDSDFENNSIKDLNVLFNHRRWGKLFKPQNTILIDDAYDHYVKNKGHNIAHIPAWDGFNSCDTVLFELQQWLEKLFANPKLDMTNIPEFEVTNRLGMSSGYKYSNSIASSIKKMDNNNRICAPKLINYFKCRDSIRKPDMNLQQKHEMLVKCTTDHLINQQPFVKPTKNSTKNYTSTKTTKKSTKQPTKKSQNSRKSSKHARVIKRPTHAAKRHTTRKH
jgi:hypothetical protein